MSSVSHIIEVALLILVAYLLGCALGYVARRIVHVRSEDRYLPATLLHKAVARPLPAQATEVAPVPPAPPSAEEPVTPKPPPPRKAPSAARRLAKAASDDDLDMVQGMAPRPAGGMQDRPPGQRDDLKKIKGIGHKSESALHALGIFHYDQVAALNAANIAWLEDNAGVKGRVVRERWIEQAKRLAGKGRPPAPPADGQ